MLRLTGATWTVEKPYRRWDPMETPFGRNLGSNNCALPLTTGISCEKTGWKATICSLTSRRMHSSATFGSSAVASVWKATGNHSTSAHLHVRTLASQKRMPILLFLLFGCVPIFPHCGRARSGEARYMHPTPEILNNASVLGELESAATEISLQPMSNSDCQLWPLRTLSPTRRKYSCKQKKKRKRKIPSRHMAFFWKVNHLT